VVGLPKKRRGRKKKKREGDPDKEGSAHLAVAVKKRGGKGQKMRRKAF